VRGRDGIIIRETDQGREEGLRKRITKRVGDVAHHPRHMREERRSIRNTPHLALVLVIATRRTTTKSIPLGFDDIIFN